MVLSEESAVAEIEVIPTPKEAAFTGEFIRVDDGWGMRDRAGFPGLVEKISQHLSVAREEKARNIELLPRVVSPKKSIALTWRGRTSA